MFGSYMFFLETDRLMDLNIDKVHFLQHEMTEEEQNFESGKKGGDFSDFRYQNMYVLLLMHKKIRSLKIELSEQ